MGDRYLVTGVSGFVGGALAKRLRALGHEVTGIARRKCVELERIGVKIINQDLSEPLDNLSKELSSAAGIFHVAARVGMWGSYSDFYKANVIATKNLLALAESSGVQRFVYTSSPSVVADGTNLRNIDEEYPYPSHHAAFYPQTKAEAEKLVLAANGKIKTLSLRPHLIFGPGDHNLVPLIVSRAKQGRLFRIGKGDNLTDVCFIDDCVDAHIRGMVALLANPDTSSGKAYFISQGEPVPLWGWIDDLLVRNGVAPLTRSLPKWGASIIAVCSEAVSRILSREPLLTRFLVCEMTTDHYFNISRARSLLGYNPKLSVREALDVTFGAEA